MDGNIFFRPLNTTQFDGQFVLLPDGTTALLHLCGNCPGWPFNALLQAISTNFGLTFSNFTLSATLPKPPACHDVVWPGGDCSWSTPQLASSTDRTHMTAVLHVYPLGDYALTARWDAAARRLLWNVPALGEQLSFMFTAILRVSTTPHVRLWSKQTHCVRHYIRASLQGPGFCRRQRGG
jgi:hypothetical protein